MTKGKLMSLDRNSVSVLELKKLLYELNDRRSYICVRLRLLGQLWQNNFTRIVTISEDDGLLLQDEGTGRFVHITKLENIMQFELDHSFSNFQAHFHYNVMVNDESAVA